MKDVFVFIKGGVITEIDAPEDINVHVIDYDMFPEIELLESIAYSEELANAYYTLLKKGWSLEDIIAIHINQIKKEEDEDAHQ